MPHDRGKGNAERHALISDVEPVKHFAHRGKYIRRLCAARGVDAHAIADQCAVLEIDECCFDAGSTDIDSDSLLLRHGTRLAAAH